jgi:hypothetical protein
MADYKFELEMTPEYGASVYLRESNVEFGLSMPIEGEKHALLVMRLKNNGIPVAVPFVFAEETLNLLMEVIEEYKGELGVENKDDRLS